MKDKAEEPSDHKTGVILMKKIKRRSTWEESLRLSTGLGKFLPGDGHPHAKVSLLRSPTSCKNGLCRLSHRLGVALEKCGLSTKRPKKGLQQLGPSVNSAPQNRRHELYAPILIKRGRSQAYS